VSTFGNEHPLDDVAAYAVGALDEVEARIVEAHLAVCGVCQAELAAHHDALARLTPDEPAQPALWARIVASLPADAGPVVPRPADADRPDTARPAPPPAAPGPPTPAPPPPPPAAGDRSGPPTLRPVPRPEAPRPRPPGDAPEPGEARDRREDDRTRPPAGGPAHLRGRPRRRGLGRVLQAAAALVVVAGLAVGATLALTQDDDDGEVAGPPPTAAPVTDVDELARAALEDPTALAVLAGEDQRPRARLVTADTGTFVVLDDLPPLSPDRAYQLWSVDGAAPVSLGVLGNGEQTAIAVAVPEGIGTVAISDAPAAGEVAPTGPIVATGAIQPA
jgi:anti-sigma-K factor RskA